MLMAHGAPRTYEHACSRHPPPRHLPGEHVVVISAAAAAAAAECSHAGTATTAPASVATPATDMAHVTHDDVRAQRVVLLPAQQRVLMAEPAAPTTTTTTSTTTSDDDGRVRDPDRTAVADAGPDNEDHHHSILTRPDEPAAQDHSPQSAPTSPHTALVEELRESAGRVVSTSTHTHTRTHTSGRVDYGFLESSNLEPIV
jgi:hypothetical protein